MHIKLDFQPGDIRNCSYSPHRHYVGVTAEDRTNGGQVVAICDLRNASTRVLVRQEYVLHHALNRAGSKVCYTLPSAKRGSADLYVFHLEEEQTRLLAEEAVGQGSTPVWFPDDTRIVYHSPDEQVEILDSVEDRRELLGEGRDPAVSPDGEYVAFRKDHDLVIWHQQDRRARHLKMRGALSRQYPADGLSWSSDGAYLSVGAFARVIGEPTIFYLLEPASGKYHKTKINYLRGLLLVDETGQQA